MSYTNKYEICERKLRFEGKTEDVIGAVIGD